jgi:hypothetical protein
LAPPEVDRECEKKRGKLYFLAIFFFTSVPELLPPLALYRSPFLSPPEGNRWCDWCKGFFFFFFFFLGKSKVKKIKKKRVKERMEGDIKEGIRHGPALLPISLVFSSTVSQGRSNRQS